MYATLLAASLVVSGQETLPEILLDGEPLRFEIDADAPALGNHGPSIAFSWSAEVDGLLHLWVTSENLDPFLRVEDSDGNLLGENDDGGLGTTAFVALEPWAADRLVVRIAATSPGRGGRAALYLRRGSVETFETEAAAEEGLLRLREARSLNLRVEQEAARGVLAAGIDRLLEETEGCASLAVHARLWDLGREAFHLDDFAGASRAWRRIHEFRTRVLPPGHAELAEVSGYLVTALIYSGQLGEARGLLEEMLAFRERVLPREDPDLLLTKLTLADTMRRMSDPEGARPLEVEVVAIRERLHPEGHRDLLNARNNLATTLMMLNDVAGARAVLQPVVAAYENAKPSDIVYAQVARANLARCLCRMGDNRGARLILEEAVALLTENASAGDPALQGVRTVLAATMTEMRDHEGARALYEEMLDCWERTGSQSHLEILRVKASLALVMGEMGDIAGALRLEEEALADMDDRGLPADHPDRLAAMEIMACSLRLKGDLPRARELIERVLEVLGQTLPADHPELQTTRVELARILAGQGERKALGVELGKLAEGVRRWVRGSLTLSPREARERTDRALEGLSTILSLTEYAEVEPAFAREVFGLAETIRSISTGEACFSAAHPRDEASKALRDEAFSLRQRVNTIMARRETETTEGRPWAGVLTDAVLELDGVEGKLRQHLVDGGWIADDVEAGALAGALPADGVAVGFLQYRKDAPPPAERQRSESGPVLLAHVLHPDGTLVRVELGPLAPIEEAVVRWRWAVGGAGGRGVPVTSIGAGSAKKLEAAGQTLRSLVLDPILQEVGDAKVLHVCLDGALHEVPLDALPVEGKSLGDQRVIRTEISFARLLTPERRGLPEPSLLTVGGVDFDAEVEDDLPTTATVAPALAPVEGARTYPPLPETRTEAERIAALFSETFGAAPVLLTGAGATKPILHRCAPRARYLHLATHGYFAEEWGESPDAPSGSRTGPATMGRRDAAGMAPLALCGLALAGANRGVSSLGRAPGIITAEEIAGLDLSGCELAVLSACETSLGLGLGMGIQSLRASLHAAGVRAAVTSLWSVPDEATKKLMLEFYRRMWVEKQPAAEALWGAKMVLREDGAPLRDWAAWVLTGDLEG